MLSALREANWIGLGRVQGYGAILFVILSLTVAWVAATSRGLVSTAGAPLGTDFTSFRAAVSLAAGGSPEKVYDQASHGEAERALFPGRDIPYYAFFYPPTFLLICLPLVLLPYGAALLVWLGATGFAYWRALRQFLPQGRAILPILGFPVFFVNTIYGQNGFLSGALMGFGALFLSRRPLVAGVCYGALVFKPHLGLLVPLALVAARAWRAFLAAGAAAVALALVSWAAFGSKTWEAFFASNRLAREALEQNRVVYEKMQSLFSFLRLSGFDLSFAYSAQALASLAAAGAIVWLAVKLRAGAALGAALAAATVLASPFLLAYDLSIAGIAIAWLAAEGLSNGFRPWEKFVLLLAYFLPLIAQVTLQLKLAIPWTPVAASLLLLAIIRRVAADAAAQPVHSKCG
jgi:hypothetical protein